MPVYRQRHVGIVRDRAHMNVDCVQSIHMSADIVNPSRQSTLSIAGHARSAMPTGGFLRSWRKEQYPWILVLYVPPSCTSKLQPQDKFYQKPFKHATMAAFLDFQLKTYRRCKATSMCSALLACDQRIRHRMQISARDFVFSVYSAYTCAQMYASSLPPAAVQHLS